MKFDLSVLNLVIERVAVVRQFDLTVFELSVFSCIVIL